MKNEINISKEHKNKEFYYDFKNANKDLKYIGSTDAVFVWYNPINYKKGQKLFSKDIKEAIIYFKNSIEFEKFKKNIIDEELRYRENFLKAILPKIQ